MPTPLIIGAGSGLVSAALFASAATATALAGVLFYLAPLAALSGRARLGRHGGAVLGAHRHGGDRREPRACHGRDLRAFDRRADRAPRLILRFCRVRPRQPQGQAGRVRSNGIRRAARRLGGADRGPARRHPRAHPRLRPGQLSRVDPPDSQSQRAEGTRSRRHAVHRGEHRAASRPCSPGRCRPPSPSSGSPSPCSICGWRD